MTEKHCPSCGSCGFPMMRPDDFAGSNPGSAYCSTCGTDDGELKPYREVVALNAEYLVRQQGIDPAAAHKLACDLLASMPAWQERRG
jgi:uncharacterized Zn finger protein (UPF0148 family)